MVINVDPDLRTQMPLEQLGLMDPQLKKVRGLLTTVGGVTLVSARSRSTNASMWALRFSTISSASRVSRASSNPTFEAGMISTTATACQP